MIDVVVYLVIGLTLLMVPGFLFSTLLYPKKESLDFWVRMGVSLGLGTMLAVIVIYTISAGLIPSLSTLSLGTFVVVTLVVCVVLAILIYPRSGFAVISDYKNGAAKVLHLREKKREPKPTIPEELRTEETEEPKPETHEEPQTKTSEEPNATP